MDAPWLPPAGSDYGRRVRRRLEDEVVIWYTSTGRDGAPAPNPVWFLPVEPGILVYNRPDAARVRHARSRGQVALHFNSNASGGDIVVFNGIAEVDESAPLPDLHAAYVEKYRARMERVSGSLEKFSESYPVAIVVRPERTRGF